VSAAIRQASCVAIDGRAVLIEGKPGIGKSSLALALLDRGATLIGDDGVCLELQGARIWAKPPPNIAGKLEIRNVGIVNLPVTEAALALVLLLDPEAPRYVEQAEEKLVMGVSVPLIRLFPDAHQLVLRAEWALKLHGLA